MDGVKEYVISWLDWGADYVRDDPADFLSKCELSRIFIHFGAHHPI